MANITWTNTFSDVAYTDLGTKLQANFSDALAVLSGNIVGANFTTTAVLNCDTVHMTGTAILSDITAETNKDIIVAVSTFSDNNFVVRDSSNNLLFAMVTDGGFQFG